jgi:hypothetical protein
MQPGEQKGDTPAALVTEKLILGIQGLSRTEISEATCY